MIEWPEQVNQLKLLLDDLKQELLPFLDQASLKEKQSQLQSIEKTIVQLQKNNTPVPEELRQLKFKLLKDIDIFFEAQKFKQEILDAISPLMVKGSASFRQPRIKKPANILSNQNCSESRITLKELIDAGVLPVPLNIHKTYKGHVFKACIKEDGVIECMINGSIQIFNSPSAAAVATTNKPQNGWIWWNIEGKPSTFTLDYYRRKLKR